MLEKHKNSRFCGVKSGAVVVVVVVVVMVVVAVVVVVAVAGATVVPVSFATPVPVFIPCDTGWRPLMERIPLSPS